MSRNKNIQNLTAESFKEKVQGKYSDILNSGYWIIHWERNAEGATEKLWVRLVKNQYDSWAIDTKLPSLYWDKLIFGF